MTEQLVLTRHPMFHDERYPSQEIPTPEQSREIREFNARIARKEIELETVPCLCGEEQADLIAVYDRYGFRQPHLLCRRCGLVRASPRLTPSALKHYYESDLYRHMLITAKPGKVNVLDPATFPAMVDRARHRYQFIRAHIGDMQEGTVGEIGCGAGWNLMPFHEAGWRVIAADYSPGLTSIGRSHGMDIRQGSTEHLASESVDVLVLSHVIEHFSSPFFEIAKMLPSVRCAGFVYIEVPNARAFCMGALQLPHLYHFAPEHLDYFVSSLGLVPVRIHDRGVHFGVLYRNSGTPVDRPMPRLHDEMEDRIRRYDRRERLKSFLDWIGILPMARSLYWLLRK